MKVLLLAEHRSGELKKVSLELVRIAAGAEVKAILFGPGADKAGQDLAKAGVSEVLCLSDSAFEHYHPEAYALAAASVVESFSPNFVLGAASSLGKDLLPRLAAKSKAPFVSDCTAISLKGRSCHRPFFSGKAMAELELGEAPLFFLSLRPNSVEPQEAGTPGKVSPMTFDFDFGSSSVEFLERSAAKSDRPDLSEANIVVSGGRSLKTRENFKLIFDCADALGAAAGASRAAVDEGLADHDMQVGQTGKTVNPSLYIACGISGAIQHLAGMRTSKVIVAINKDSNAPIFSKADYGVVGDLFEILPLLTAEVKKLLGKAA